MNFIVDVFAGFMSFLHNLTPIQIKIITACVGPIWGLFLMRVCYRMFDNITPFITADELKDGNISVGIVVGSMFIGIGICVGLVTGFSVF